MAPTFSILIMAAGKGTRMRSSLPKVLQPVCGKPMVQWVIDSARHAGAADVVCITRPGDGVAGGLPEGVTVAQQTEGEGTGSAILAAREAAGNAKNVVVLSGDHPLVSADLLQQLMATHEHEGATATLLTTEEIDPSGYGRVVRAADGGIERIVETKDTEGVPAEELAIREINVGAYAFVGAELWEALDAVPEEANGERYLTAVVPEMRAKGQRLVSHLTTDVHSAMGINDRADLMDAEREAQRRILRGHAAAGVTFLGPDSTRVEAGVSIGEDTTIQPGVTLGGATEIGAGCQIGPATTIIDTTLADGVTVLHSFLTQARVERNAGIGPFAYLRPAAHIGAGAKVGTFVEVKNSEIGAGAKVPHLSYLGDADVGEQANIAAGNITANYDGFAKHRTRIGGGVKTGVNTSFIAPVTVGEGAYIGAGSVITEDVPPGALGISRPEQTNVDGYAQRMEEDRG